MRKEPIKLPENISLETKATTGYVTETRHYKLITPLFGGGVEAGKPDLTMPIRASSIRGQLRFWWRATRGGQFGGSLERMKRAEDWLWGSSVESEENKKVKKEESLGHSRVHLNILEVSKPYYVDPYKSSIKNNKKIWETDQNVAPGYASFPLRPDNRDKEAKPLTSRDLTFSLEIKYPSTIPEGLLPSNNPIQEVQAALWAWEIFGGLGARTRRGFGSLVRTDNTDNQKNVPLEAYLAQGLSGYRVKGTWPKGVPHLPDSFGDSLRLIKRENLKAPEKIWDDLIVRLQKFRQARPQGFKSRNQWPEPDVIRELTNMFPDKHTPWERWEGNRAKYLEPVRSFPRATFGLPVIFHFKDGGDAKHEDRIDTNGHFDFEDGITSEPWDTTLQGRNIKEKNKGLRLASPLILKSIQAGELMAGLAVILQNTGVSYLPDGIELVSPKLGEKEQVLHFTVTEKISSQDAKEIPPLENRKMNTDPLKAFLETL